MLLAAVTAWLWQPPVWVQLVMCIPMVADGCIQLWTRYESTNLRRFVTGVLFGYAMIMLLIAFTEGLIRFGMALGLRMQRKGA